ncbi:hypothetical protein J6590_014193 [Homalodisca vitripennis]|nr:hypothetical protein J6590_014193 [Homalodisca vitripennis]
MVFQCTQEIDLSPRTDQNHYEETHKQLECLTNLFVSHVVLTAKVSPGNCALYGEGCRTSRLFPGLTHGGHQQLMKTMVSYCIGHSTMMIISRADLLPASLGNMTKI